MASQTDSLQRQVQIHAPRAKVWRALTTAEEFGKWFGVNFKSKSFQPGMHTQGNITIPGYDHITMDVLIERIEPETLFSWRWHPYAIDSNKDYSKEERTIVTFELKDADGGTLITVTESGFDKIPPERRLDAFRMNGNGWTAQMENIQKHVQGQTK